MLTNYLLRISIKGEKTKLLEKTYSVGLVARRRASGDNSD
jgi:hypothetical protein